MSDTPENHSDGQDPEKNPKGYKVGRGRPPMDKQFPPGRSGNPTGKRKSQLPYGDLLNRILRERIPGQENGKPVSLSRAKSWVKRLVYLGAIVGDPVAEDILLSFEKPWESAPTATCEFRLADSEDDIPSHPKTQRSA